VIISDNQKVFNSCSLSVYIFEYLNKPAVAAAATMALVDFRACLHWCRSCFGRH